MKKIPLGVIKTSTDKTKKVEKEKSRKKYLQDIIDFDLLSYEVHKKFAWIIKKDENVIEIGLKLVGNYEKIANLQDDLKGGMSEINKLNNQNKLTITVSQPSKEYALIISNRMLPELTLKIEGLNFKE